MNGLNKMLVQAAVKGNVAKVKLLLSLGAEPKAYNSDALYMAAYYGHTDCVKLLIPVSDPKANDSWALYLAAYYGHTDCVKLLIPVSDPKAYNSGALYWAMAHGHTDCVKLLMPVSSLVDVLWEHPQGVPVFTRISILFYVIKSIITRRLSKC